MTLFGVAGAALLVACVCAALKETGRGFYAFAAAGGGILLSAWAVLRLTGVAEAFAGLATDTVLSPYITVILRAVGVGYVVKIAADSCRDLGASETAARLEMCGRAEILVMAVPYMTELIRLAVSLVEGGI